MTTIITRLYSDPSAAQAALAALLDIGQDKDTIRIISGTVEGGAVAAMKAARVSAVSAETYAKAMTGNQALLVVEAPFSPIGTARNAIKMLRRHPALDVGIADEDVYLREYPNAEYSNAVMTNHPLLLTNPFRPLSHGHIFGENPVSPSKERTSAIRGGAYMSRMFWPMKLTSAPKHATSAIRGGMLVSSLFGLPVLTGSSKSR